MAVRTLRELDKMIRNEISKVLVKEVAAEVKKVESENIEQTVYNVYEPTVYERRGEEDGGLGDIDNMVVELTDEMTLRVSNRTPPHPGYKHDALTKSYIDEAVEYGEKYDYYNPGERPFTQETVKDLKANKQHIDAMKEGLRKAGLSVK